MTATTTRAARRSTTCSACRYIMLRQTTSKLVHTNMTVFRCWYVWCDSVSTQLCWDWTLCWCWPLWSSFAASARSRTWTSLLKHEEMYMKAMCNTDESCQVHGMNHMFCVTSGVYRSTYFWGQSTCDELFIIESAILWDCWERGLRLSTFECWDWTLCWCWPFWSSFAAGARSRIWTSFLTHEMYMNAMCNTDESCPVHGMNHVFCVTSGVYRSAYFWGRSTCDELFMIASAVLWDCRERGLRLWTFEWS